MSSLEENHAHEHFDPGSLYQEQWVKDIIQQIQTFLQEHTEWLGLDESTGQRVLDYACGDGAVSKALLKSLPSATFQGIDVHPAQVRRYNDAATQAPKRMYAVEGDFSDPQPQSDQPEWFDFDVTIISMALHHVADPIGMLRQLRKRTKQAGRMLVVEWLRQDTAHLLAGFSGHHDTANMIETIGHQKVWPGFTTDGIRDMLDAAGFSDVQTKVHPETFRVPAQTSGLQDDGHNRLVFVKATVC